MRYSTPTGPSIFRLNSATFNFLRALTEGHTECHYDEINTEGHWIWEDAADEDLGATTSTHVARREVTLQDWKLAQIRALALEDINIMALEDLVIHKGCVLNLALSFIHTLEPSFVNGIHHEVTWIT